MSSGVGPMLYSTPLYFKPRFLFQYLLKSVDLGPWPFRALRIGRASRYEMGIEGIDAVASSTGARGAPGFEGYPGVVLEGQLSSQSRIGCHIRITGADAQELSTSTLNGTWVPCRTLRVRLISVLFSSLTIIARVAVNKNTSETKLLCTLDFETSEDSAISSNGNLALDVNLGIDEILIILVSSIVDVDEGSSNVSAG